MSARLTNLADGFIFDASFVGLLTGAVDELLAENNLEGGEVGLILADDRYLQRLNRQFRGLDEPTDVLSFSYLEPAGAEGPADLHFAVGDIYISLDRARAQANEAGHPLEAEIAFLVIHGLLHLFGLDHSGDQDRALMEEQENRIIEKYGFNLSGG